MVQVACVRMNMKPVFLGSLGANIAETLDQTSTVGIEFVGSQQAALIGAMAARTGVEPVYQP